MVKNKWAEELIRANSVCYEKPIELRSEKVRNIIGQIPPVFLRYGIVIISLSLLMLVGISAFIPYQPGINIEINITQTEEGCLHYSAQIPESAMKTRLQFTEVQFNSSATLPLPVRFEIESISDVVQFTGNDAWQTAVLRPVEPSKKDILLKHSVNVQGKILLEKQSLMMWVVRKVLW